MAKSGEACECGGRLKVYCSRRGEKGCKRYLECSVCKKKPAGNVEVVDDLHEQGRNKNTDKTYFARCGDDGPLKIGFTASSVLNRVAAIQSACPFDLKLMGWVNGDYEAQLHQKFAHLRIRGEWFSPSVELIEFVESLISGNCNLAELKVVKSPGDGCECGGKLIVYSTSVKGRSRHQYLRCNQCGVSPEVNPISIPLMYAPRKVCSE